LNLSNLLVVEDDPHTAELLRLYLTRDGHAVQVAVDGDSGLRIAHERPPDLVVLDLMLPGLDGFAVCRALRAMGDVPILILSARGEEGDRVLGLELGADDYVVKPFSPREIVVRVRAILRRAQRVPHTGGRTIVHGPHALDLERQTLRVADRELPLTPAELRLLEAFFRAPRRTLSRDELIRVLYPLGGGIVPKAIDLHVQKLRRKLGDDPRRPRHLVAVRGFGYRLEVTT
jgi:DNA-binding response OmpR family regulator